MVNEVKGSKVTGLLGATIGFFAGFASVALFGPTASRLKSVMDMTPTMVGLLVAAPSLSGSLLRIPFGAWVDTTGGRKPFLILLWTSVVGMAGLLLAIHFLYPAALTRAMYPLLLVLGVFSGCGIATFSVGIGQVSYWFEQDRQGTALGAYAGLGNLAPGLFSFLLPVVLGSWGLSGAYLAWLLFLLLGTGLYHLLGRNAPYFQLLSKETAFERARQTAIQHGQEIFPTGNARESLTNAAGSWRTWLLVAIYFTTFGGFIGMTAWLPTYWEEFFTLGAVVAGSLTALYSLVASAIRVPGGSIADRLGGENTAIVSLATMMVGAILMMLSRSINLSVTGVLLMAVGMGTANAAVFKLMPQYVPEAVGGAAGWIGGLGAFGGFVIPPLMGVMVRSQGQIGYGTGFVVYVTLSLISLIIACSLKLTYTPHVTTTASGD